MTLTACVTDFNATSAGIAPPWLYCVGQVSVVETVVLHSFICLFSNEQ